MGTTVRDGHSNVLTLHASGQQLAVEIFLPNATHAKALRDALQHWETEGLAFTLRDRAGYLARIR